MTVSTIEFAFIITFPSGEQLDASAAAIMNGNLCTAFDVSYTQQWGYSANPGDDIRDFNECLMFSLVDGDLDDDSKSRGIWESDAGEYKVRLNYRSDR